MDGTVLFLSVRCLIILVSMAAVSVGWCAGLLFAHRCRQHPDADRYVGISGISTCAATVQFLFFCRAWIALSCLRCLELHRPVPLTTAVLRCPCVCSFSRSGGGGTRQFSRRGADGGQVQGAGAAGCESPFLKLPTNSTMRAHTEGRTEGPPGHILSANLVSGLLSCVRRRCTRPWQGTNG